MNKRFIILLLLITLHPLSSSTFLKDLHYTEQPRPTTPGYLINPKSLSEMIKENSEENNKSCDKKWLLTSESFLLRSVIYSLTLLGFITTYNTAFSNDNTSEINPAYIKLVPITDAVLTGIVFARQVHARWKHHRDAENFAAHHELFKKNQKCWNKKHLNCIQYIKK